MGKFTEIIDSLYKKCGLKTRVFSTIVLLGSLVGAFCYLFEKYTGGEIANEDLKTQISSIGRDIEQIEQKIEGLEIEIIR